MIMGIPSRQCPKIVALKSQHLNSIPVDNFGTVLGENPTPYGILALWAVNSLSIVYWDGTESAKLVALKSQNNAWWVVRLERSKREREMGWVKVCRDDTMNLWVQWKWNEFVLMFAAGDISVVSLSGLRCTTNEWTVMQRKCIQTWIKPKCMGSFNIFCMCVEYSHSNFSGCRSLVVLWNPQRICCKFNWVI